MRARECESVKIQKNTFLRIKTNVPGLLRIGYRSAKILGRLSKFAEKCQVDFLTGKVVEMERESVHVGWDRVEMKRGAVEKILEVPEVEDSRIIGQFLVIIF